MSDAEMATYATYGGFLVMVLLILYHFETNPVSSK